MSSEFIMREPIVITSDDPILKSLKFKPHRNTERRRVVSFAPADDEPQTMEVVTPWGARLTAKKGDMLVSEVDSPEDIWPVDADIFDKSYIIVSPGYCIKSAVTMLVPLTDLTDGDEDQLVTVQSLEGPETVRAGDFFLAKGVKDELWPYPKHKAAEVKSLSNDRDFFIDYMKSIVSRLWILIFLLLPGRHRLWRFGYFYWRGLA